MSYQKKYILFFNTIGKILINNTSNQNTFNENTHHNTKHEKNFKIMQILFTYIPIYILKTVNFDLNFITP